MGAAFRLQCARALFALDHAANRPGHWLARCAFDLGLPPLWCAQIAMTLCGHHLGGLAWRLFPREAASL